MRCYNCSCFSLSSFCKDCENELKEFSLGIRVLDNDFKVYYFYKYSDIKHLLLSKHKFHGYFIYNFLAKITSFEFKKNFKPNEIINIIALDDKVENMLYSHCAIIAKYFKSYYLRPVFNVLKSTNNIKYSGKSLKFRETNKRKYKLLKKIKYPVILVDDIVTTGNTLIEAKNFLIKNKIKVLFALVLADAKE